MSSHLPIVFMDSGKGGLPYLAEYQAHDPTRSLAYIADTAAFPYGMKSGAELCRILLPTVQRVIDLLNPAIIVLACNTASVTALKWLRQRVSVPLVGVVPAVKPASAQTSEGKIGLLVTERTAAGDYLHDLIGQFAADRVVITVVASDIVAYVESRAVSLSIDPSPSINALIAEVVEELARHDIDTLVLGCTHFVYIATLLQRKAQEMREGRPPLLILDSRIGVINRIRKLARDIPPAPPAQRQYIPCYSTTADLSPSFERLLRHCHIQHQGVV